MTYKLAKFTFQYRKNFYLADSIDGKPLFVRPQDIIRIAACDGYSLVRINYMDDKGVIVNRTEYIKESPDEAAEIVNKALRGEA